MFRSAHVKPCDVEVLRDTEYDAVFATLGYERRARYITENLGIHGRLGFAPAFENRQVLDFNQNQTHFSAAGFLTDSVSDQAFERYAKECLSKVIADTDKEHVKLCIDVSSMSRLRMAAVVGALATSVSSKEFEVDFVYALAAFTPPPVENAPIVECGPVSAAFAGQLGDIADPMAAVFGAGYEEDQIIGVMELLEAGDVWAFVPEGVDPRYRESVDAANATLWEQIAFGRRCYYSVMRPVETFNAVESLLYGLQMGRRPVVVPFGPKIFTVICLLACVRLEGRVPLWRVSTGQSDIPMDRWASGDVTAMTATFAARRSEGDEGLKELEVVCTPRIPD